MHLGLVYPCLLGARMLGSTVFPWLISGPSPLRTEDCLVYSFIVLGLVLSIIAYDYQVHISDSYGNIRKNISHSGSGARCSEVYSVHFLYAGN